MVDLGTDFYLCKESIKKVGKCRLVLLFSGVTGLPGNRLQVWHFAPLDYGRGVMECY